MRMVPFLDEPRGVETLLGGTPDLEALRSVDAALRSFAGEIGGSTRGLCLNVSNHVEPDEPVALTGYAENAEVTFWVKLTRRAEGLVVEGEVYVVNDAPVDSGQVCVHELDPAPVVDASAAPRTLGRAVATLRALSDRRPATAEAWR